MGAYVLLWEKKLVSTKQQPEGLKNEANIEALKSSTNGP